MMKRKNIQKINFTRKFIICASLFAISMLSMGFTKQNNLFDLAAEPTNISEVSNTNYEEEQLSDENLVETPDGFLPYTQMIVMEAAAYLPSDSNGSGLTATGIPATYGIVAVDPSVIPLGTQLYIPEYGMAVAADTGGMIYGNKIDLCMESYTDAINFGRRDVEVYILK